tara:strand:- start:167 stop:487 length:321 start_codon:yes stop_codon:yes gene_type:complete
MANQTNTNPLSEKDPQEKMSKEEMAQRREEITEFYKDNIPHLEIQADYEMLLASIEKSRAERMQAQMFMAQQYAAQNGQGVDPNSEEGQAFQEAMAKAMEGEKQES